MGGGECSPTLLTRNFLLTYWEKGKGKWRRKEGKLKKGGGKLIFFFFFFFFSLFKTTEICFGSTKMGIFYPEKAFHAGKKSGKMTLFLLKNIPLMPLDGRYLFIILRDSKSIIRIIYYWQWHQDVLLDTELKNIQNKQMFTMCYCRLKSSMPVANTIDADMMTTI